MPSQLETAMDAIIKVFGEEKGVNHKLARAALKNLLKENLKCFLKNQKNSNTVDDFTDYLWWWNRVGFEEFMRLVTNITFAWKGFLDDDWKKQWKGQLSHLESAMDTTIKVFYKYSGKEGDKTKLPKDKLKNLLEKELKNFLENKSVDNFMMELECNEQVDFKEFMHVVTAITIDC